MNLFKELRAERLSPAGRGVLWTLMSYECERLSDETMLYLLGMDWQTMVHEVTSNGFGVLIEPEPSVYVFRRFKTTSDRRREAKRIWSRKRKTEVR